MHTRLVSRRCASAALLEMTLDDETVALRLLSDRRRELVRTRTQTLNRIHQLLMELIPSGAPKRLSAAKAKQLVATVRPRDVAGRTRRAMVVEMIDDIVILDRKVKAVTKQIREAVAATGTTLTDIVGVGPVIAATILGEVGDVSRFPSRHHFASFTGTAPVEASSGEIVRHRLTRFGNRQLNHVLHTAAIVHSPTTRAAAPTTTARKPPARAASARCAASSDDSPTPSIARSSPTGH